MSSGTDRHAATMEEREVAARLQERMDGPRSAESDLMHRVVRATGGGWVEVQAEFLSHVLDVLEGQIDGG